MSTMSTMSTMTPVHYLSADTDALSVAGAALRPGDFDAAAWWARDAKLLRSHIRAKLSGGSRSERHHDGREGSVPPVASSREIRRYMARFLKTAEARRGEWAVDDIRFAEYYLNAIGALIHVEIMLTRRDVSFRDSVPDFFLRFVRSKLESLLEAA